MDPRCAVFVVMGKTDPKPTPTTSSRWCWCRSIPRCDGAALAAGVRLPRPAWACRDRLRRRTRPGEQRARRGRRRLRHRAGAAGPGRIHHCMRAIGTAERALELMTRAVADAGGVRASAGRRASCRVDRHPRIEIEQARLLVLKAAWMIDERGAKAARKEIAAIKAVAPSMALGGGSGDSDLRGAGVSDDTRSPRGGPACARCASLTVPTRCTCGMARMELGDAMARLERLERLEQPAGSRS